MKHIGFSLIRVCSKHILFRHWTPKLLRKTVEYDVVKVKIYIIIVSGRSKPHPTPRTPHINVEWVKITPTILRTLYYNIDIGGWGVGGGRWCTNGIHCSLIVHTLKNAHFTPLIKKFSSSFGAQCGPF